MNAVASTLVSDQPLRVFSGDLWQRLDAVNDAIRKLREHDIKVNGQELRVDTDERPVVHTDAPPPRSTGFWLSRLGTRKDGVPVRITQFGDVDIAWPTERVS